VLRRKEKLQSYENFFSMLLKIAAKQKIKTSAIDGEKFSSFADVLPVIFFLIYKIFVSFYKDLLIDSIFILLVWM
jgi:hypothetical protein